MLHGFGYHELLWLMQSLGECSDYFLFIRHTAALTNASTQLLYLESHKYVRHAACFNHLIHRICDGALLLAYMCAPCFMEVPA